MKILSIILALCGFAAGVRLQRQPPCATTGDVHLDVKKSTVYITYESVGKCKAEPTRLAAQASAASPDQPDKQKLDAANKGNECLWLRLHNNTQWSIRFDTESLYVGPSVSPLRLCDGRGALGLREGVEVNARYAVEGVRYREVIRTPDGGVDRRMVEAPKPPALDRSDVFSASWLPPGRSATFSVNREHLAEHLAVYIAYSYEWENENLPEPHHRVYFYASNLPDSVRR